MAFSRRILSVADQLTATLDKRYANINHNHDTIYSKLDHTHTANQISGFLNAWDQRSIVIEPIYSTIGQVYEVKQDGWLRISLLTWYQAVLLTIPLSSYDDRITNYASLPVGTTWKAWDILVKHNGNYWLAKNGGTVGNANQGPGESGNRWIMLPPWIPCIGIAHSDAGGEGDQTSGTIVIPCRAGEQYVSLVSSADGRSTNKQMRGYGCDSIQNRVYIQYLPPVYQDTAIGLTVVEDRRLADKTYRYNTYLNVLTKTPILQS